MESLRNLFWLHYQPAGPLIPLWDEWMPMSTPLAGARRRAGIGPDARPLGFGSGEPCHQCRRLRQYAAARWTGACRGLAFSTLDASGGVGWHFRGTGVPGYDGPPATKPIGC